MSTDRETTRIVRAWLREDEHESAERVLDAVLAELDTTPQRGALGPAGRFVAMNGYLKLAAAAVLLTAIAFGAYSFTSRNSVGVTPDSTAAPTSAPASLSDAPQFRLPGGRYVTDGAFGQRVVVTLPEGWSKDQYNAGTASLLKPAGEGRNAAFVSFYTVTAIYDDPCEGRLAATLPQDAEGLVAAFRSQPGFDIGPMTESTVDGRRAWTWEVTAAVDISTCVDDPWLYQWQYPTTAATVTDAGTIAGAVQRLTVVEMNESPLLVEVGTFEWTTDADRQEAYRIADTITFD